jgi:hypothetical protein
MSVINNESVTNTDISFPCDFEATVHTFFNQ